MKIKVTFVGCSGYPEFDEFTVHSASFTPHGIVFTFDSARNARIYGLNYRDFDGAIFTVSD